MNSGWNSGFEGIIAFKKVCEHNKNFLALVRGTRVNRALSNADGVSPTGWISEFTCTTQTHCTCPPEVVGLVVQESSRGRYPVGIGT